MNTFSTQRFAFILTISILLAGCNGCKQVPNERLAQFMPELTVTHSADSLIVFLQNPIASPLQFVASSQNEVIQKFLTDSFPIVLSGYADTTLVFISDNFPETPRIRMNTFFGDPYAPFSPPVLELPFPKGKSYTVLQGYYGSFSHNTDFSRYAIDFNMAIGDTITVAAYGYVVGVIDGYKHGGNSPKWRDYANFISVYHPEFGAFTQYVHLVHEGSLVSLGDTVATGQPIALSGNTGFSTSPHLHFNVLRPLKGAVVSTPVASIGNYQGEELKRGFVASN
jgi:murein DD-endopeptidase MepM/ murein hydrolase activator NlpD